MQKRCSWATSDPVYIKYHDEEWGIPLHDDRQLFEFLCLEGAQAGLSWITILKKRDHYRQVFDNFDPAVIVNYDKNKINLLMSDPGIIRNRKKIEAVILNAEAFLRIQKEFGSFDKYIWQFVGGSPLINHWSDSRSVPTTTSESIAMSSDLKKRGFKFVGPTICYAFMQATGMVNDHTLDCYLYERRIKQERA